MSITSSRGSRHGVENPWRPLAVLRPRWVRRRRTRPPSRLTRTRLPAKGPSLGTGTRRAAASAASRRGVLVVYSNSADNSIAPKTGYNALISAHVGGGNAMVSQHVFSQLVLFALIW